MINKIVADFLAVEGHKDALHIFHHESGTTVPPLGESIEYRNTIRQNIQDGDIDASISTINAFDSKFLENNESIHFQILQQKLIELIRHGNPLEAILFAQTNLSVFASKNEKYLDILEEILILTMLPSLENLHDCVGKYLSESHKNKLINELNKCILLTQSSQIESKLPNLLKTLFYLQKKLNESVNFPKIDDIVKATLSDKNSASRNLEEDDEDEEEISMDQEDDNDVISNILSESLIASVEPNVASTGIQEQESQNQDTTIAVYNQPVDAVVHALPNINEGNSENSDNMDET